MRKAQGSLEYLIIITAVLAISAIVVLYVTNVFQTQSGTVTIATCKQAAAECRLLKMTAPDDPCNMCVDACIDPISNQPIIPGAVQCCKQGEPQNIYDGSTACGSGLGATASFTANPTSGVSPLTVEFDASASTPSSEGTTIVSYEWDFGDPGSFFPNTGEGETISHVYINSGNFTVTLIVIDDTGATDTATQIIEVLLPPHWHTETIDSTLLTGWSLSLDIGPDGVSQVSYNKVGSPAELRYAKRTGENNWDSEILDSSGQAVFQNSIAVDSDNNPHIAWHFNGNNIRRTYNTGSDWQMEVVDSGDVGKYNSIDIGPGNTIHIAYYDNANNRIKYAKYSGASWSTEIVDNVGDEGIMGGYYVSIAVDSNNNPHISYFDFVNNDLKYAFKDFRVWVPAGSGWETEIVAADNAEFDTSIALDSNNNPHISYYDSTNRDLKYAKNTGSGWETETVDSEGWSGRYNSIAIDSNNIPRIAYRDETRDVLKYAYWTGSDWYFYRGIGTGGYHTSIAINPVTDYPAIAFHNGDYVEYVYFE